VQRELASPQVSGGVGQFAQPAHVGGLRLAVRLVAVKQYRQL
jgi:hypothetical protein